jgi:hypothetical protein
MVTPPAARGGAAALCVDVHSILEKLSVRTRRAALSRPGHRGTLLGATFAFDLDSGVRSTRRSLAHKESEV